MSDFEQALAASVARVLERTGTAMAVTRAGAPAYDPGTGEVSRSATVFPLTGVIEEVETGHPDGSIRRGDLIVTVAAEIFAVPGPSSPGPSSPGLPNPGPPAPGDELTIQGVTYRLVSVATTWAGDRPALYRLHARL